MLKFSRPKSFRRSLTQFPNYLCLIFRTLFPAALSHGLSVEGDSDAALDQWEIWVESQASDASDASDADTLSAPDLSDVETLTASEHSDEETLSAWENSDAETLTASEHSDEETFPG